MSARRPSLAPPTTAVGAAPTAPPPTPASIPTTPFPGISPSSPNGHGHHTSQGRRLSKHSLMQRHKDSQAPNPPRTVREVGDAVERMDSIHGTSFAEWIRSEGNIGYLSTFKRHLFESHPLPSVIMVLQWLTEEWSVPSVAELILKLFYTHRVDSARFATILAGVTSDWNIERTSHIVEVLLIGETAEATARFFVRFFGLRRDDKTHAAGDAGEPVAVRRWWPRVSAVEVLKSAGEALRWNENFSKEFALEFTSFAGLNADSLHIVHARIHESFSSTSASMTPATPTASEVLAIMQSTDEDALDEYMTSLSLGKWSDASQSGREERIGRRKRAVEVASRFAGDVVYGFMGDGLDEEEDDGEFDGAVRCDDGEKMWDLVRSDSGFC